jgi:integrase
MAKKNGERLILHGKKWWLRLPIPRPVQRKGLILSSTGRPLTKITEPMAADYAIAKLKQKQREAECAVVFDQIEAGAITTPQQAKAALTRGPRDEDDPQDPTYAAKLREANRRFAIERRALWEEYQGRLFEAYGNSGPSLEELGWRRVLPDGSLAPVAPTAPTAGETISQAAEAWFAELTRDETAAPRDATLGGHRLRVRAFTDKVGDVPLADVTRAMASDFLAGLKVKNRTRNNYATTLKCVFDCARRRGRLQGDNPFDDMKAKVAGSSYQPFTVAELQTLFAELPREVRPKRHTPDTALPWAALVALYTGARLEEVAQLTTADVREEIANGATVWVVDVHNGGDNKLKNESAPRLIPVHSELVRLGLLDYVKALPRGPLFPGLKRRTSKGGKVGARVGELFRKRLVALGLKRDGLVFHSFRHNVATALRVAGVPQEDAARVLGHAVAGMSYGTYAQAGPGLKRVAAVVEQIAYEGLRL